MLDREKVIKGLSCCINGGNQVPACENCPYADEQGTCEKIDELHGDALELLKEQEPVELINIGDDFVGNGEHVEIHDRWKCSGCGYVIYSKEKPKKVKYCLNCGKAVKWDD